MTLPEVLLWQQLKLRPGGYQFRKQHPLGRYVLDFACIRARLAIEIDGEAHNRSGHPERDDARDAWVLTQGFATLRFPALEVLKNMEGVVIAIVEACAARAQPNPLLKGDVARSDRGAGLRRVRLSTVRSPSIDPSTASGFPLRFGEEFA